MSAGRVLIAVGVLSTLIVAPAGAQGTSEVIAEVRVHGNARLPDDEVVRIAGVTVGQPFDQATMNAIEARLRESGRFDVIELRKRYRSLDDLTQVALVVVVHERPEGPGSAITRPFRKLTNRVMFLPILKYDDGYGFTYGARATTKNALGAGERLSVPLTWGGTKRAAFEAERSFTRGPLTRVQSSVAVWSRENPHFLLNDHRVEWRASAERDLFSLVRLTAETSRSQVSFGSLDERLWTYGGTVALDTRGDPAFPSNAVYALAGWRALNLDAGRARVDVVRGDLRGYWRPVGQAVIAARVRYEGANRTLPDYERLLVGGSSSLRGLRTGTFAGDRTIGTSAELRVPISSPLSVGRLGVTLFVDSAKYYDVGQRAADARWYRGAGAGLFLIAPFVKINLDVARSLDGRGGRVHLSTGFAF